MGAQSDVERNRRAIQGLQRKIAAESGKVAAARDKESRARREAAKATSASSAGSKLREAERRGKEAVDAEKRRSNFEKQLADKQKALHQAEAKVAKELAVEQERSLRRLEDRARRSEQQFRNVASPTAPSVAKRTPSDVAETHDVFICHASEDKEEVARPLATLLMERGMKVWYDEFSLTIGDSLRDSIDQGLAGSRFGAIVLSPDFFKKEWPRAELDGLVAKQRASGGKVLLPIWHRITRDEVLAQSPTLAGLKALNTSVMSLADIADEIARVVRPS